MSATRPKAAKLARRKPPLERKQPPAPERVRGTARPMTGFFQGLTPEQKRRALEHRGDDWHGDEETAPRLKKKEKEPVPA